MPKTIKRANPHWIVDGQQRISSFCILFGEKPYWWPSTKDWEKRMEKYDVMINVETKEIKLSNPPRKRDPKWISFKEILKIDEEKEIKSLAKSLSKKAHLDYADVVDVLKDVYYIKSHYEVPILTIHHRIEEVVDIFGRLNKKGTKVGEAEIIKGLIASINAKWLKSEFEKTLEGWKHLGWNFDPIIILRTLAAIGKGKTTLKEVKNDFWKNEIDKYWKPTVKAINSVIVKFKEYGISSIDLIPSKNSLVPTFLLYYKFQNKNLNFDYLVDWLLLANYTERYSGSAQYTMQKDVNDIKKAKTFNEAIYTLFKNIEDETHISPKIEITPELVKSSRYNAGKGKLIKLLLYMTMFKSDARDWITKTKIGYEKGAAKALDNFSPEWHHIFPKNVLKKYKYSTSEINSVANITVLTSGANKKLKKEPWEYIWEFKINNKMLREHLVPPSFKGWTPKMDKKQLKKIWNHRNYRKFLDERAKVISREINKYLKELEPK